jgi:hypothetical protein
LSVKVLVSFYIDKRMVDFDNNNLLCIERIRIKMKRKIVILVFVLFVIVSTISIYAFSNNNYKNIYYGNGFSDDYLKSINITFQPTDTSPKIDKKEIKSIAERMLKESSMKPKEVYLQYGLITDKGASINIFSKEYLEKNPTLKDKTYINEIPVWLITFKGLLKDDYDDSNISNDLPGKQPLNINTAVIDAMSGAVLYSFGTGKGYK